MRCPDDWLQGFAIDGNTLTGARLVNWRDVMAGAALFLTYATLFLNGTLCVVYRAVDAPPGRAPPPVTELLPQRLFATSSN